MNTYRKRQIKTMVILLVLCVLTLAAGVYLRVSSQKPRTVAVNSATVSADITEALKRYAGHGVDEIAQVRTAAASAVTQKSEVVFAGLPSPAQTRELIQTLQTTGVQASFFISGMDAANNQSSLELILSNGYSIGTIGNTTADIAQESGESAVGNLCRANGSMQAAAGVLPTQLLCFSEPSEEICAAAYACYIDTIVVPDMTAEISQFESAESALETVNTINRGKVLCVRLSAASRNVAANVNNLIGVLSDTDLSAVAQARAAETSEEVSAITRVYTTERAVAFTFSGFGNSDELSSLLVSLGNLNARATFFVTRDELANCADDIQLVLNDGHRLGIAVQAARFSSVSALLEELLLTQEGIRAKFAYTDELPVRPSYGTANEALRRACGAGGFTLLASMLDAVRTEDIRKVDAYAVLDDLLPPEDGYLQRGEIVHFQMKQFQQSNAMLGELVQAIVADRCCYSVKPIMEILGNVNEIYTYPLPASAILPSVKDKIFPGQLSGDPMEAIIARYIGIDWVNSTSFLPGFTYKEIKKLDRKGLIANDRNMIFLTFDDWGTDKTVTDLLDVLKAHNAKATFFIRTENVVYNPNLLRAIALEGHTIGCHTNTHFPLSNDTGSGKNFTELTEIQVAGLKLDMVNAYQLLQSVVGDVVSSGRPALSLLFRPPTLAVSKNGLAAVFDCGFTYSVSGYYTAQDYKATNPESLAKTLESNSKSGAILILHISDTSVYTAQAVDEYLTAMEQREVSQRFLFASLADVLN